MSVLSSEAYLFIWKLKGIHFLLLWGNQPVLSGYLYLFLPNEDFDRLAAGCVRLRFPLLCGHKLQFMCFPNKPLTRVCVCVSVGDLSKKISIFCANNHLASQNDSINIDVILVYGCILNVKSDCLTSKDVARITSMLSIKKYPLQIESNTLLLWIWHPLSMRWCTADEITLETLIQITQMHLRITSVTDIVASFIYFFLFRLQLPVFIRLPVCIIIRGTIATL